MISWINATELLRLKSSNLQGSVKIQMRDNLENLKIVSSIFMSRAMLDSPEDKLREENLTLRRENEALYKINEESRRHLARRMAADRQETHGEEGDGEKAKLKKCITRLEDEVRQMRELYVKAINEIQDTNKKLIEVIAQLMGGGGWSGVGVSNAPRLSEKDYLSLPKAKDKRGRKPSGEEFLADNSREIRTPQEGPSVAGGEQRGEDEEWRTMG